MKYFVSVLRGRAAAQAAQSGQPAQPAQTMEGLVLGIPTEAVGSLTLFTGVVRGLVEDAGDERRFALPHFFGFPEEEIRHGIILKGEGGRRVLLLSAVERELEFSAGEIYRPPALFGALGKYTFLSGLCFQTLDSGVLLPLLLIDPFRLTEEMLLTGEMLHDQYVNC
jgi:hypothetical protein